MITVTLKIYNSAGEVIKTFPDILLHQNLTSLQFGDGSKVNVFHLGVDDGLTINVSGDHGSVIKIPWDGRNDLGTLVDTGEYLLKAESISEGNVTTLTASITVIKSGNPISVGIYTASGELVRNLFEGNVLKGGKLQAISMDKTVLRPKDHLNDTVGIKIVGINNITLLALPNNIPLDLQWNGMNALGTLVANGEYILKAEEMYEGQRRIVTKNVTVIRGEAKKSLGVFVYPNPYKGSTGNEQMYFKVILGDPSSVTISIYNVGGELIKTLTAFASTVETIISWNVSSLASGVYLAVAETHSVLTGVTEKKMVKLAIIK